MTALDARDRFEDVLREQLGKAWRTGIAYCASNLATPGVPLGYPEEEAGTEAVLAVFDACAEEDGDADGARLLKVKEVADAGRVSPGSVYGAIKRGELKAVRVGRGWRIRERDARRYLGAANGGH